MSFSDASTAGPLHSSPGASSSYNGVAVTWLCLGCEMMITTSFFPILSINEDVPTSYKPFCTDHSHSPHSRCTLSLLLLPSSLSPLSLSKYFINGPLDDSIQHCKLGETTSNIRSVFAGMCMYVCVCVCVCVYVCVCACRLHWCWCLKCSDGSV